MSKKATAIAHPTWYGQIRNMFNQKDVDHMKPQGFDLTDYNFVKNYAPAIHGQIAANNMPPGNPWPQDWKDTFLNWMIDGYPKGTSPKGEFGVAESAALKKSAAPVASRIRKEISELSATELANFTKALKGIMALDNSLEYSYFKLAGDHGLPNPYCMHHISGYNPWHRAYLVKFENALRSIPGCENVTLPYWDITKPLPDFYYKAPFASYTLPEAIGTDYPAGTTTSRFTNAQIQDNFTMRTVFDKFNLAYTKSDWEDYHGLLDGRSNNTTFSGHDNGHNSIGDSMGNQQIAAFDPVFWLYHCNLDRLFWNWQKHMNATTPNGLLTTIESQVSRDIFVIEALEALPPFTATAPGLTTLSIIDSVNSLDVDYKDPKASKDSFKLKLRPKTMGTVAATENFKVNTDMAAVRVAGINRLKIPGSFDVHLLKDGKVIATNGFFQPVEVEKCGNCVENAVVHVDFHLPLATVSKGELSVWVEPLNHGPFGDHFPHKMMGNPTINVRLLLQHE